MLSCQIFSNSDWCSLKEKASASPRKRAHFNLHHSYEDLVQKVLICLLKETYIPPHFHKHDHQKELFLVFEGKLKVLIFDKEGSVKDIYFLGEGERSSIIEIMPNTIHTVVCLSESAFILEVKQGPFLVNDCKEFLAWSVGADSSKNAELVGWLKRAKVGETVESVIN